MADNLIYICILIAAIAISAAIILIRRADWLRKLSEAPEEEAELDLRTLCYGIRTNLLAMRGFLDIAQSDSENEEKVRHCTANVKKSGDRLLELVDATLGGPEAVVAPEKPKEGVDTTENAEEITVTRKSLSGHRVLLVEDDEISRGILREHLETLGIDVDTAENGLVAVGKLNLEQADRYDLIFMDISMPLMNGYETAKKIRAMDDTMKAAIPIIAMTANTFAQDRYLAFKAGMNEHLYKPVDMNKLQETLIRFL